MITIFQDKKSQTRKNNIDNYIAPFPWLIIMRVPNCFGGFLFVGILLNSEDNMVDWRTFFICKYLCIPMKYPSILVSFPLKISIFLLWNSWGFYLSIKQGLWYIPEKKLFIILWEDIIWRKMVILDTSSKNNDTVCSTSRMTVNVLECTFKSLVPSWTFGYSSKITITDNLFAR